MNVMSKFLGLAIVGAVIASTATAGKLIVETNTTVPVRINGSAASVVLGNQNIADVAVHDEHLIFITGKSFGTTNLLIFDKDGREIYNTELAVSVNTANQVTVNRSGLSYTYNCAPDCRPVLSTGDDDEHFQRTYTQLENLKALSEGN